MEGHETALLLFYIALLSQSAPANQGFPSAPAISPISSGLPLGHPVYHQGAEVNLVHFALSHGHLQVHSYRPPGYYIHRLPVNLVNLSLYSFKD